MARTAALAALAAVALVASAATAAAAVTHPTPELAARLLGVGVDDLASLTPQQLVRAAASGIVRASGADPEELARETVADASAYPYFAFMFPDTAAKLTPGGAAATWSNECFANNTATLAPGADNTTFSLTITASQPTSLLCSDFYFMATLSGYDRLTIFTAGAHTVEWKLPADARPSEVWDVMNVGVRVFAQNGSWLENIGHLVKTALLFFDDAVGPSVPSWAGAMNHDFVTKYMPFAGQTMSPRTVQTVNISDSDVESGDIFSIIRMDGLDPMLAWAMGSTTGHVTVALRDDSGQLYVTESTVKDAYWPTDGVQKTPFATWVQQAHAAGFNFVHAPLSAAARKAFNATAAWERFNATEGFEYGYRNLLFSWIDTPKGNFPCMPPDFKKCMSWDLLEIVIGLLARYVPSLGDMIFAQAMSHRLGAVGAGLTTPDIFMEAAERGLSVQDDLIAMPEQDDWVYNTTRNGKPAEGPSMVCCVYVSNIWKAGGLYGDDVGEIQAGEQTNADVHGSALLDKSPKRPPQCVAADPANPNCQLGGRYELILNRLGEIPVYAHMNEKCPSQGPNYTRPANC